MMENDGKSMKIHEYWKHAEVLKIQSDGKCSKHHISNAKSRETHDGTTTQIVRNTECSRRKRGQYPTDAKSARHHIRNRGDLSEHNMGVSYNWLVVSDSCNVHENRMMIPDNQYTFQGVETTNKT